MRSTILGNDLKTGQHVQSYFFKGVLHPAQYGVLSYYGHSHNYLYIKGNLKVVVSYDGKALKR